MSNHLEEVGIIVLILLGAKGDILPDTRSNDF